MILENIKQEVIELHDEFKGSHDYDHVKRVYNLCLHIGKAENADMDILKMAALLHDIGRKCQDESKGKICHAEHGAGMAKEILKKYDIDPNKVEKILHCIKSHRYRGENIPLSKEAKILFDADKLDGIGAVGIGRAFLFAGENGGRLHNNEVDIEKTKAYSKEDTAYREYMLKLKFIKDKILTDEGKRIAEKRHEFMDKFFQQMNGEVKGNW